MTEMFISAQNYGLSEALWAPSMTVCCMSGVLRMSTTALQTRSPPPAVCRPRSTACQSNLVTRHTPSYSVFRGKILWQNWSFAIRKQNTHQYKHPLYCIFGAIFRKYFIPDQYLHLSYHLL